MKKIAYLILAAVLVAGCSQDAEATEPIAPITFGLATQCGPLGCVQDRVIITSFGLPTRTVQRTRQVTRSQPVRQTVTYETAPVIKDCLITEIQVPVTTWVEETIMVPKKVRRAVTHYETRQVTAPVVQTVCQTCVSAPVAAVECVNCATVQTMSHEMHETKNKTVTWERKGLLRWRRVQSGGMH